MIWFFKKVSEDENIIIIGYSFQEDTCDGRIIYNKKTHEKTLAKVYLVKNYDEEFSLFVGEKAFQYLNRLVRKNMITEKPITISIG